MNIAWKGKFSHRLYPPSFHALRPQPPVGTAGATAGGRRAQCCARVSPRSAAAESCRCWLWRFLCPHSLRNHHSDSFYLHSPYGHFSSLLSIRQSVRHPNSVGERPAAPRADLPFQFNRTLQNCCSFQLRTRVNILVHRLSLCFSAAPRFTGSGDGKGESTLGKPPRFAYRNALPNVISHTMAQLVELFSSVSLKVMEKQLPWIYNFRWYPSKLLCSQLAHNRARTSTRLKFHFIRWISLHFALKFPSLFWIPAFTFRLCNYLLHCMKNVICSSSPSLALSVSLRPKIQWIFNWKRENSSHSSRGCSPHDANTE